MEFRYEFSFKVMCKTGADSTIKMY